MSEMPERIWAWGNYRRHWRWSQSGEVPATEYIRADVASGRIAELEAALRERELWMDATQKKIKELEGQAKAFSG